MTVYYVRKTGNDTTGDGSTGNPWLTISKALLTVSAAGGHTINVGAGTYGENTSATGYLYLTIAYSAEVVIQSESGNLADVIIQSATDVSWTVRIAGSANLTIKNVTIQPRLDTMTYVIRVSGGSVTNFKLDGCLIACYAGHGLMGTADAGQAYSGITVNNCTITQLGTGDLTGIYLYTNTGTLSNVSIDNLTATVVKSAIDIQGAVGVAVSNSNLRSTSTSPALFIKDTDTTTLTNNWVLSSHIPLELGSDSYAGAAMTGVKVIGGTYISTASHGLLVGSAVDSAILEDVVVVGYNQGLVFKHATNGTARRCRISTVAGRATYCKNAVNCEFIDCTVTASSADADLLGATDGSSHCRWLFNVFVSSIAKVFLFGADQSWMEVNYNTYQISGTATWGTVNATVVASLAAARTAWLSGAFTKNDDESIAGSVRLPDVGNAAAAALADYDPPTNAEMEARTLPAASYFDPMTDTVTPSGGSINSVSGTVGSIATDGITAAAVSAAAASKIAAAVIAGGTGTYSYTNTVDDGSGNLLDGVFVQCATDSAMTNIVYTTHTNSLGAYTVYDDVAGTHYIRYQLGGYESETFTVTLA